MKRIRNHFSKMGRALRYRNFRLFVGGQSLSLIGTWIQMIAINWLVYQLTGSVVMLGLVNFLHRFPFFALGPFGGVIADRFDKHKMLLITQSLALIQGLILTVMYFLGTLTIFEIMLLTLVLGVISAIDMPIRQAFVSEMVDNKKEDINNAVAFNSTMVNTARLVGPLIAGIIIIEFGEGWCFAANTISYIAVVVSLLMMVVPPKAPTKAVKNVFAEIKEGAVYAFSSVSIKNILLLLAVVGFFSISITTLAPAYAKLVLGGDVGSYGLLMTAFGVGALSSAVYLLGRQEAVGLERLSVYAVFLLGISVVLFSISDSMLMAFILMAFAGAGFLMELASSNTLLQTISLPEKRGKVMGFYAMAFAGMSPFGSMLSGFLASWIGVRFTLIICGLAIIAAASVYSRNISEISIQVKALLARE